MMSQGNSAKRQIVLELLKLLQKNGGQFPNSLHAARIALISKHNYNTNILKRQFTRKIFHMNIIYEYWCKKSNIKFKWTDFIKKTTLRKLHDQEGLLKEFQDSSVLGKTLK